MISSEFVQHAPCPSCGSSDANSLYDDGHTHCFACQATQQHAEAPTRTRRRATVSIDLLPSGGPYTGRGLTLETTSRYRYTVGHCGGRPCHIAPYRNHDGADVAQKLRFADKTFSVTGDLKSAVLFGQHLFDDGGKRIVVTEGEIDAMSVAQAFGNRWAAVSVPNGASGAKRAVAQQIEYLNSFDEVVIGFDNDDAGRKAAVECAALFSPGKVKIADWPAKDANELLQAHRIRELTTAVYEARSWRPGGIVSGADIWDRINVRSTKGLSYPWPTLTEKMGGQLPKKLITWTSGSGMGKSTAVAQVAYEMAFTHDQRVGYVALEEDVGEAASRFLSLHLGKRVHIHGEATESELRAAFDATLASGKVWFHDHFGSTDSDDLLGKLRYLIVSCGCSTIVLDHLSIVVSGMELSADERRTIDRTMTMLRTLVEETGCTMHLVSHLKRPDGQRSHEEGGRVTLGHLRGSQSIAQLSDQVVGLERNQQAEGDEQDQVTLRILKNRTTGITGKSGVLQYDRRTGRLSELAAAEGF